MMLGTGIVSQQVDLENSHLSDMCNVYDALVLNLKSAHVVS